MAPPTITKLETAPADPRFQNINQNLYCYESYLDFHRCRKLKGDKYDGCKFFERCYKSMCPNDWTRKWDEEIKNGNFAGASRI